MNPRNRVNGSNAGFTLVELLVVTLIIGLLALIAIPTFLSQRHKAQDASAKSNLRNSAEGAVTLKDKQNDWSGSDVNNSIKLANKLEEDEPGFTYVGGSSPESNAPNQINVVLSNDKKEISMGSRSDSGRFLCVYINSSGHLSWSYANSLIDCLSQNGGPTGAPATPECGPSASPEELEAALNAYDSYFGSNMSDLSPYDYDGDGSQPYTATDDPVFMTKTNELKAIFEAANGCGGSNTNFHWVDNVSDGIKSYEFTAGDIVAGYNGQEVVMGAILSPTAPQHMWLIYYAAADRGSWLSPNKKKALCAKSSEDEVDGSQLDLYENIGDWWSTNSGAACTS